MLFGIIELNADELFILDTVSLLSSGLELIWENRKSKRSTALFSMRAELEASVSIKRKSRLRKVKVAADIMQNMLDNFLNDVV